MELPVHIKNLAESPEIRIAFGFLIAFVVTYVSIPSIIAVSRMKQLFAESNERTVHSENIPTLGGLAMFAGFTLAVSLVVNSGSFPELSYVIAAIIVIFFVGIKDDILIIAPLTKLGGQLLAAAILIFLADIRFTNLHGFNNIFEINYTASFFLTAFVMIVIINGLNLIDGIDGLASGIGMVTTTTLGIYFYLRGNTELVILAAAMVGGLAAFFRFNFFCTRNKIFMGDTGSLLLGLLITVLIVKFNEFNIDPEVSYFVHSAPSVSFGILVVPLFDIIRVMLIRIGLKRNPFKPDKNHIHHKLLRLGYSHKKSTIILMLINILFIAFSFQFSYVSIRRLLLLILIIAMGLSYLPDLIRKNKKRNYEE